MTTGHKASEPTCKWIAIRAVDALPPEEKAAYRKHLQQGCPVCGPDPQTLGAVAQQFGFAITPVTPPSSLRERLVHRISRMQAGAEADVGAEETVTASSRPLPVWAGLWPWASRPRLSWLPAAAVVCMAFFGTWATLSVWNGTPAFSPADDEEAYINALFARVAAIVRVGLGDHIHCTVFRKFPKDPPSEEKMVAKLGPDYGGLVRLVKERVSDEFGISLGHRCRYRGRKFVHLALKSETKLLSVIITDKQPGESFSQETLLPVLHDAGVPIYRAGVDRFELAGFESEEYLVYVISDLTQDGNLQFAAQLAPALHDFLEELTHKTAALNSAGERTVSPAS